MELWKSDGKLISLEDFAFSYPNYAASTVPVYRILRDIVLKNELDSIAIFDAEEFRVSSYFLKGRSNISGRNRILVPVSMSDDIDLAWYCFI